MDILRLDLCSEIIHFQKTWKSVTAMNPVMGRISFCLFCWQKRLHVHEYMYSHDICEVAAIDFFNQACQRLNTYTCM